jgi:hypothetical protein
MSTTQELLSRLEDVIERAGSVLRKKQASGEPVSEDELDAEERKIAGAFADAREAAKAARAEGTGF